MENAMNEPVAHRKPKWAVFVALIVLGVVSVWFLGRLYTRGLSGVPEEFPERTTPQIVRPLPNPAILDAVDDVLAALPKAPMAFNTPPPMNIDDTASKVELRVGPRQSPAELAKSITAPGTVQVHEVQISNRMKSSLSGDADGLTITPLTPALQAVSGQTPTVWVWSVKPRKVGRYPIHVELEAEVKIDGEVTPRLIDVFDGAITVTITPRQRVEHFAKDNWQWLWTALLVPVGGWWWKRKSKKDEIDVS